MRLLAGTIFLSFLMVACTTEEAAAQQEIVAEDSGGGDNDDPNPETGGGDGTSSGPQDGKPRILVFTRTEGFRHGSIADGLRMFEQLAEENLWEVVSTEDAGQFQTGQLVGFDLVVFMNTTGDVLDREQEVAFESYIQGGGSFMGIHAATDTEYEWAWYGELVGAYFNGHPSVQQATVEVVNGDHPSTASLERSWERRDEWYNFRNLQSDIVPLLMLDEGTYQGGTMGDFHPISWFRTFDGGRSFYTGMGHTPDTYNEPDFREHIKGAVLWCLAE